MTFGISGAQSVIVHSTTPAGTSSTFDGAYDSGTQTTVTGTIIGLGSSKPAKDMPANSRILVQTLGHSPSTYVVELGPNWFVNSQSTKLRLGQWVKVTGSKITDRHETKILAKDVQLHNHTNLALRRMNGDPYWADIASNAPVAKSPSAPLVGTILNSGTMVIGGVTYPAITVQTPDGPMNVLVPQQQNGYVPQSYQVGNNIQVIPSPGYPVAVSGNSNYPPSLYSAAGGGFVQPIVPRMPHFWF